MKNKILSLVCASAMVMTVASSFIVAEAAGEPQIKLVANFEDTGLTLDDTIDDEFNYEDYWDAPVYKATLTIQGPEKKAAVKEGGTTVAYTGTFVDSIQTVHKYASTSDELICVKKVPGIAGTLSNTANGELTTAWSTADSGAYIKAETVVYTWYIVSADKTEIEDFTMTADTTQTQKVIIPEWYNGTTKDKQAKLTYSAAAGTLQFVDYPAASSVITADDVVGDIKATVGDTNYSLQKATFALDPDTEINVDMSDGETHKYDSFILPGVEGAGSASIFVIVKDAAGTLTGKTLNVKFTAKADGTELGTLDFQF